MGGHRRGAARIRVSAVVLPRVVDGERRGVLEVGARGGVLGVDHTVARAVAGGRGDLQCGAGEVSARAKMIRAWGQNRVFRQSRLSGYQM